MDDPLISAATHGVAVLGGGSAATWIAKLVFGSIVKRLEKIEEALERMAKRDEERNELRIKEMGKIESKADAAFSKIDSLKATVDELRGRVTDLEREGRAESRKRTR